MLTDFPYILTEHAQGRIIGEGLLLIGVNTAQVFFTF
jgi:hypothetical protein